MTYETPHGARHVTGWVGWVWFAGLMMIMSGVFNAITGLYGIFNNHMYVTGAGELMILSLTGWGWVHLIFGILLVIAGVALTAGQLWARIVAIVLAAINAMTQLLWIDVNPWWSLAVIAVDVLVLYALIVHGREAAAL
ncbi:hypothetical protein ABZ297_04315 [Nonomuraea sp. NPDC005983]|uniref:DUF7144 family membrane protein n=1 Tax=Nonomuraea sp. NPDC005983 TaxID=3155595 RepID=UPI0033BB342F